MSVPVSYAADGCYIIALYALKLALFRSLRSRLFVLGCFFIGVAVIIPLTWVTSPDWNNPHVYRIGIWIGDPIAVLAVPTVSFFFDYFKGDYYLRGFQTVRFLLEILVGVPVWFIIWVYIQCFLLGWVWI